MEILRGSIFHTPRNPFEVSTALVALADGALVIDQGRVVACGDYSAAQATWPAAAVRDLRGSYILPGFVDTHIHFPQVRILGRLGYALLDWLERFTLPEEARLALPEYAAQLAAEFTRNLAACGTTTALVFGSHFVQATAALFESAQQAGLRIISGLVLSDRLLRPELHQTPEAAYQGCLSLIHRYHGQGNLGCAVIPRFALSAGEPMLAVCATLLKEHPTLHFTSHINENAQEVQEVARLFPGSSDYLDVYEKFGLVGRRSVLAHNVQAKPSELTRMAAHQCPVAHCPASNAMLGSGIFPMRSHLNAGVRFALGTDVGGGIGFGMLKEALQAYMMQRVAPLQVTLSAAQMLYLATRAGAEALALESEIGDFEPGKSADFVCLRPPTRSVLAGALQNADGPDCILAALITLAGNEAIAEVRVKGELVFANQRAQ